MDFVASLSPFCDNPKDTKQTLLALMQERAPGSMETKYAVWRRARHLRRLSMTNQARRERYASRLDDLEESGYMLMDTRDALAEALRALAPSPAPEAGKPHPPIDLSGGFLAGADLRGVNRQEVNLTGAYLAGTGVK
jgi:uncharacterized protein YjbI with pentapeptide repeats